MLTDMTGQELAVDDYVCDDRGRTYRLLETQRTIAKQLLASAAQVRLGKRGISMIGAPTYVRTYLVYKLPELQPEVDARASWLRAWREEKAKDKQSEFAQRKAKVAETWEQVQQGAAQ